MSCSGPSGRGVNSASQAPDSTRARRPPLAPRARPAPSCRCRPRRDQDEAAAPAGRVAQQAGELVDEWLALKQLHHRRRLASPCAVGRPPAGRSLPRDGPRFTPSSQSAGRRLKSRLWASRPRNPPARVAARRRPGFSSSSSGRVGLNPRRRVPMKIAGPSNKSRPSAQFSSPSRRVGEWPVGAGPPPRHAPTWRRHAPGPTPAAPSARSRAARPRAAAGRRR